MPLNKKCKNILAGVKDLFKEPFVQCLILQNYIKMCIKTLPKQDLIFLKKEFEDWIRKDFYKSGPGAPHVYRIPGGMFSYQEIPEDVTDFHDYMLKKFGLNLEDFTDDGISMHEEIYDMIIAGMKAKKKGYFEKFHHFIYYCYCDEFNKCIPDELIKY